MLVRWSTETQHTQSDHREGHVKEYAIYSVVSLTVSADFAGKCLFVNQTASNDILILSITHVHAPCLKKCLKREEIISLRFEPHHGKTNNLHRRKQRRRSAKLISAFVFATRIV